MKEQFALAASKDVLKHLDVAAEKPVSAVAKHLRTF